MFCPGSFDPVTYGHIDIVSHAASLCEKLVVGVGINPAKQGLFTADERISLIQEALRDNPGTVEVISFSGLASAAAQRIGASVIIRGLRDASDFDYEMRMASMNSQLAPDLQTLFLPASIAVRPISATFVRQIAERGGNVSPFVPQHVVRALHEKYAIDPNPTGKLSS